jgi:hypothetical protein
MPQKGHGGGEEDGRGQGRGRGQGIGFHDGRALGGRQYQTRGGPQNETGPKAGTPECLKYKPRE